MRIVYFALLAGSLLTGLPAMGAGMDGSRVDQALVKTGTAQPGDVHKYGLPRTDLHVTVDGMAIKPALALGGWLAFKPMGEATMVMGDLVMAEDESNPVKAKLLANGITVTAMHKHLLRAQPATFYMHVAGLGDPVKLATALHDALGASKTPLGDTPPPPSSQAPAAGSEQPTRLDLDRATIDRGLGAKGTANGGVYQFTIPRAEVVSNGVMAVPPAMATAIAINFQPTGSGKAAITGDFVLLATEVTPVLKPLRENGIEVTAVHNHMLDDQPHTFFIHFWANNDATKLAQGLRAALDKTHVVKS
jgi:hypothetical protein